MARYAKIGHKMGSLRKWLPEVTTTLLCLLIVGTVLRVVSATEKGITILLHFNSLFIRTLGLRLSTVLK